MPFRAILQCPEYLVSEPLIEPTGLEVEGIQVDQRAALCPCGLLDRCEQKRAEP